jgi:hypothetical protein
MADMIRMFSDISISQGASKIGFNKNKYVTKNKADSVMRMRNYSSIRIDVPYTKKV